MFHAGDIVRIKFGRCGSGVTFVAEATTYAWNGDALVSGRTLAGVPYGPVREWDLELVKAKAWGD